MSKSEEILQGVEHFRLFVARDEWQSCLDFYEGALGLQRLALDPEGGFAIFRCGQDLRPTLGLEAVEAGEAEDLELTGRFTGLSFRVADIAAVYQALTARGVAFEGSPEVMDWGGTLAHVRDPAGNILTLVQLPPTGAAIPG